MLAAENGKLCWADFKKQIAAAPQGSILPYSIELKEAGYPVLWFSNVGEAESYIAQNGGKLVKVANQAVVAPK